MQTMKDLTVDRAQMVAELTVMYHNNPTVLLSYIDEVEQFFKKKMIDEELKTYLLDCGREVLNREIGWISN